MTFLAYGAGAVLAASGTRVAAIVFGSAAVLAAIRPDDGSAVIAWTAVMAGGLIAAGIAPRRIAVPAIGAAAAIAAGSADNAAVVLGLWTLGTAAAVAVRPPGAPGRRWAFALLVSDILFASTVAHAATHGFAPWPGRLGSVGTGLLLASALARVPAIGWPAQRPENGLVLVRAQTIVLIAMAMQAAPRDVLVAGLVGGAAVFALGAYAGPTVRDGAQEAGLVAMAVAVTQLGWRPAGWVWGALAGGTLMHHLRLTATGLEAVSGLARAMERSAGVGLPLLPAVGAVMAAVLGRTDYVRVTVLAAIGLGLAGRASSATFQRQAEVEGLRGWREAIVLASGTAALAAPLLSLPRPPGGDILSWPPLWAVAGAVVVGCVGLALPSLAPAAEPITSRPRLEVPVAAPAMRLLDPPGGDRVLFALLAALVAAAAGVLVLGWLRGFL